MIRFENGPRKKKSDVSDSSIDLSNNFNQDNIEGEDDDVAQERRKVDQIMNNELLTEEVIILSFKCLWYCTADA